MATPKRGQHTFYCMAKGCSAPSGHGQVLCVHHRRLCSIDVQLECRNANDALNSDYSPENMARWTRAYQAAGAIEERRDHE